MRTSQYRHFARSVQKQTTQLVVDYLRPRDFSAICTAWTLLSSLVLAAACRVSLAAVAVLRPRSPCRETLRQALLETLPEYAQLRQRLAGLVGASLPRRLRKRKRRYPLAIDIHSVAYYKRQCLPPEHVCKGKAMKGTPYGHHYATASLLLKGQYFVVALTVYDPGEGYAALLRRLIRQACANGFSPRYVLLDRSFWSAEVVRYLQHARYPFLMPVLARGKKAGTPGGPTGTRVFFHNRKTGWYTYRFTRSRSGKPATVTIAVHRRNRAGQRGKHGRYAWAFALWRMNLSTVVHVRESYRRRFRIESSYRLLEEVRARTSSRNETWRLWYIVLAILLINCWLELRREVSRRLNKELTERYWWNRLLIALAWELLSQAATESPPTNSELPESETFAPARQ
jgi:putative transposase